MLYKGLFVAPNCPGKHNLTDEHGRNHVECTEEALLWSDVGEVLVRFKAQGFLTGRGSWEQSQLLYPMAYVSRI